MSFEAPDREQFHVFSDVYGTKGGQQLHYVCDVRSQHEGLQVACGLRTWHMYQPHTGEVVYIPPGKIRPVRVAAEGWWRERVNAAMDGSPQKVATAPTPSAFQRVIGVLFNNRYAALAEL